jgi:hypothetical protein
MIDKEVTIGNPLVHIYSAIYAASAMSKARCFMSSP